MYCTCIINGLNLEIFYTVCNVKMNYVNLYKDLTNMHEFLHIPYVAIVTGNMWIFVELNPEKNYF